MASVQRRVQRGRVSYRAIWKERGPGNKPRQRNKSFSTASAAKQYATRMEQEVENRGVGDPERQTVAQFLNTWLEFLRDGGEKSPTTIDCYRRNINIVCREIGHILLSKLTAADLDMAYSRLRKDGGRRHKPGKLRPLTGRTLASCHRMLCTAFKKAKRWKLIPESPTDDVTAPTPEDSRARAFSVEEVQRLLQEAAQDPETYVIAATLLSCGLRRGELLGLAEDAIDFTARTLTVKRTVLAIDGNPPLLSDRTKTKTSRRELEIPSQLVELLRGQLTRVKENMLLWGKTYQRQPLLLFPGLGGTPLAPRYLTRRLTSLLRRAKIDRAQPCHAWRHTSATQLFDAGHHLKTVQTRLGHSSPAITLKLYVHAVDGRDREAADHFDTLIGGSKRERPVS